MGRTDGPLLEVSDEGAARDAIARMGNQVLRRRAVCRSGPGRLRRRRGPKGGRRDWTTKGAWCQELDRALFGLPIGQLSPIIEGPMASTSFA